MNECSLDCDFVPYCPLKQINSFSPPYCKESTGKENWEISTLLFNWHYDLQVRGISNCSSFFPILIPPGTPFFTPPELVGNILSTWAPMDQSQRKGVDILLSMLYFENKCKAFTYLPFSSLQSPIILNVLGRCTNNPVSGSCS